MSQFTIQDIFVFHYVAYFFDKIWSIYGLLFDTWSHSLSKDNLKQFKIMMIYYYKV